MQIEGTIDHIIFRNNENGYTVLELLKEDEDPVTVTGCMPELDPGEMVVFTGEYTKHPVYDLQFRMTAYAIKRPEDTVSILRYLSSGAVKGIGKGLAGRIVERFGEDSFRILEEEPERLAEIKGISIRKAMEISAAFESKSASRQAFSFLQQFGISNAMAQRIYDTYQNGIYDIIRSNPYRLIEDIEGIGFKTADRIASEAGIRVDSEYRVRSGILYALQEAEGDGNICLPRESLIAGAADLLSVSVEEITDQLRNLSMERKILLKDSEGDGVMVYSERAYYAEAECARMLLDLNRKEEGSEYYRKEIEKLEKKAEILLEDKQREAVLRSVTDGVLIMTGGPGTGKTTTINLMLRFFVSNGYDIMLTAPTGRAAKRMSEATGFEARTIHRLLGVHPVEASGSGKTGRFEHDADSPLETDVLIVDEMSMVDIFLFRSLLRAVAPGTKLILVGDENQLPSVGPGAVLKDIIASGVFSVVTLTRIFRQSEAGDIVLNAHNICMGKDIRLDNKSKDFFFLEREESETIIRGIEYLIKSKLPPYIGCRSEEIQIMSPMRKGSLGVESLNIRLQEIFNPPEPGKRELETQSGILRTGDKVLQIKNDYDIEWEIVTRKGFVTENGKGIFNGDVGSIVRIADSVVTVRFEDGRQADYQGETLSELELAYAITIHKSQGSEYPAVIIPLLSGPGILMNRNLLYTGVTRAQKCVVLMGRRQTILDMIANTNEQRRYTGLKERIHEIYEMEGNT